MNNLHALIIALTVIATTAEASAETQFYEKVNLCVLEKARAYVIVNGKRHWKTSFVWENIQKNSFEMEDCHRRVKAGQYDKK